MVKNQNLFDLKKPKVHQNGKCDFQQRQNLCEQNRKSVDASHKILQFTTQNIMSSLTLGAKALYYVAA